MVKQHLEMFFADYAAKMTAALSETPVVDTEANASAFAEYFVEANPKGVLCGKNDAQFRQQIPKGFEFHRSIGTKTMEIAGLEITTLDALHAMVKVHWDSHSLEQDGRVVRIQFDVIYLVQTIGDQPKIFAYITGDEKVLREKGLI